MRNVSQEYVDLSLYRFETAEDDLESAKILYDNEKYKAANNRGYYAIFHALRSVLILDGFDSKKHSGIISEFRRRYIKEGIFSEEISKMLGSAFEVRTDSDYKDNYMVDREMTERQIENAEKVVGEIRKYLMSEGIIKE